MVSLRNDVWGTSHTELGSASDCLYTAEGNFQPIRSTTQIVSMEFLRSFLRLHFAGNRWWRHKTSAVLSGYFRSRPLCLIEQCWFKKKINVDYSQGFKVLHKILFLLYITSSFFDLLTPENKMDKQIALLKIIVQREQRRNTDKLFMILFRKHDLIKRRRFPHWHFIQGFHLAINSKRLYIR